MIARRADTDGVDSAVVERDYVLAHIVGQLHSAKPKDGGRLVFKGGTALRLVHIGEYRYSADLDFSVVRGTAEAAIASVPEVLETAREFAGFPHLELTQANKPKIAYIGPLESRKPREVKLDIATDEYVETVEQLGIRPVWQGSSGCRSLRCIPNLRGRGRKVAMHYPARPMSRFV